jgi:uncharacterized protein (DUF433 family)
MAIASISTDPTIRGGKPHIADTRIAVADVALMHLKRGLSPEQIAARFDLSLAAVHAAMAYYYDHRDEIDLRTHDDDAYVESLRRQAPSRLQAKLNT